MDSVKHVVTAGTNVTAKTLCDSCPAEGRFAAVKGKITLKFCAHHARAHEASLTERKFVISPSDYKF